MPTSPFQRTEFRIESFAAGETYRSSSDLDPERSLLPHLYTFPALLHAADKCCDAGLPLKHAIGLGRLMKGIWHRNVLHY